MSQLLTLLALTNIREGLQQSITILWDTYEALVKPVSFGPSNHFDWNNYTIFASSAAGIKTSLLVPSARCVTLHKSPTFDTKHSNDYHSWSPGTNSVAFCPTVALSGAAAGRPTDLNLIMVTRKVTKVQRHLLWDWAQKNSQTQPATSILQTSWKRENHQPKVR
jgi:hypothetical protein